SNLLDRSVAPLTVLTARQIFNATTQLQSQILIVLDGFNECSAEVQGQLVSDLTALSLRQKFVLLLTSQVLVSLPPQIDTESIHMGVLGMSDKEAVLASYRAPEIAGISEPFQTTYELSLAAECAAELKAPVTRGQLFDAFVRRSLASASSPAATRAGLRQVALAMDERLTAALPMDEVWRSAERAIAQQIASLASVDDLFRCKLVRMQQGWLAFSHELLGRFLAGEALLLNNEPRQLAQQLDRPRHADLPELVLPLETRATDLHIVLTNLADVKLYLKSLNGELGRLASDVAKGQAYAALATTVTLMDEVSLVFQHLESLPQADLDRDGLSRSECAILSAAAKLLPAGHFLGEALEVFDATDRALHRAAHAYNQDKNKVLSPTALAATIIGIRPEHRRQLPAAILIEGCEHARHDYQFRRRIFEPINPAMLETLILDVQPNNYSRLYFLC
ncbi:MAG: hypothetical protein LC776_09450, partial [Acidobacteria bacterium]|nr:hypothetical protein [Acidobacteriota bacterium]